MSNESSRQNDRQTVLVVATDPLVLEDISEFLAKAGYNILSAGDGAEAVQKMKKYKQEIHLLLSTLDMPGVNGLGLAAQVSILWPHVKVLLMSECGAGTLVLNEGWHFLPKPFVESQLQALIRTLITPEDAIPKYQRPGLPPEIALTAKSPV